MFNYFQLHEHMLTKKKLSSTTFKYMNVYLFNYFFSTPYTLKYFQWYHILHGKME